MLLRNIGFRKKISGYLKKIAYSQKFPYIIQKDHTFNVLRNGIKEMNKKIFSLILMLMLNVAVMSQQPDSTVTDQSDIKSETQTVLQRASSQENSRQARVIKPVTNTNWSKIKDLFK
ncbi:hypothetical protein CHISP_2091 [Chitinispirillum alkaliphilum]|nr:hypothetical protein CHISP_2091 [Chitinispirillum alkaliphilum]